MSSILLFSTYEMGHQPLSLAWPLAALKRAGMSAQVADLSLEPLPVASTQDAELVILAAPMHTALRLAVDAARAIRNSDSQAHICFTGLYAWLNADYLLDETELADSVIGGEVEPVIVALAQAIERGDDLTDVPGLRTRKGYSPPNLARIDFPLPERTSLPALGEYARLMIDGEARLAGTVEASRGCLHRCLHCPVVPIYDGRFFVVPRETVLADIEQQVAAGAQHITFADPDFLNGPGHVLPLVEEMQGRHPGLTFDFTARVEHLLAHREKLPDLVSAGALFVISAFESTSDRVLQRLDKGHTRADMEEVVGLLREVGLHVQPTWLPFTPWGTLDEYREMLAWIRRLNLVAAVPAVQLSIRLLIPPGSALLKGDGVERWLGPLETEHFGYRWRHSDPRVDSLQQSVSRIAESAVDEPPEITFHRIEILANEIAGGKAPEQRPPFAPQPPRLSEHWFC